MSPTDAEQWETIALFNKCQAQNLRTKYDTLQASHTNLKDTLQLFVGLLEHQGSFIQKRDIERAKQDLKEAEKI